MDSFLSNDPQPVETYKINNSQSILVLAPHPDDFDAIGVSLRYFHGKGNPIYLAVATSGASGVEDSFCSPPTREAKGKLREEEQRASCRYFGLPEENLTFLRLEEDQEGHPLDDKNNLLIIQYFFMKIRPDMVFLPHGEDTNPGHQRIYAMFRQVATGAGYPLVAFLNRDPKTVRMCAEVYMAYGGESAAWKGELLRYHQSQHQRNLNQRGHGIDERILRMDRENAALCSLDFEYAEVFELEYYGGNMG